MVRGHVPVSPKLPDGRTRWFMCDIDSIGPLKSPQYPFI